MCHQNLVYIVKSSPSIGRPNLYDLDQSCLELDICDSEKYNLPTSESSFGGY